MTRMPKPTREHHAMTLVAAVSAALLTLGPTGVIAQAPEPSPSDTIPQDTIPLDTVLSQSIRPGPAQLAMTQPDTVPADTFALPGIVVTATRVPLAREALPTPVTVWTARELRSRGVRTVAEALRAAPSASVARAGSPGAQTSLFLRGGEADYVKVLIDGVAVNDPGGAYDFGDLSTDQVERIEIVRGPVSVLYGSDAVAGVVQIFTRRGSGAPRITAQVTGGRGQERGAAGSASDPESAVPGTYGLGEVEATVTGSTDRLTYAVGGGRSWSSGLYPVNNERDHATGTTRLGWTPAPGLELALSTRLSRSRSHFPTDGTGAVVDENARLDRHSSTSSIAAGLRLTNNLEARIQAGYATRRQRTVDDRDGPADTLGVFQSSLEWDLDRWSVDARLDATMPRDILPSTTVSAGITWEEARAATRYSSRSDFGPLDGSADFDRGTMGYYAQALSEPVSGVHLTVGGRLDESDTYGAFGTYRLGLAAELSSGTRARGALGRGFKEPAFDQVFGSGFGDTGNPSLEPERSRSWELGIEQTVGVGERTGSVAATWFDQRFERLIQFTFSPPAPDDPNYFNVGAASARGLELEASATLMSLHVDASYAYLETEVLDPGLATDAGFVEGAPLLRRPAHAGNLTTRYSLRRGSIALTVHAVGVREDLDFAAGFPAPRVTLPAYATLDLAAEREVPVPGIDATALLRIENALDTSYQGIAGFPGVGRVVRVGARLRLR